MGEHYDINLNQNADNQEQKCQLFNLDVTNGLCSYNIQFLKENQVLIENLVYDVQLHNQVQQSLPKLDFRRFSEGHYLKMKAMTKIYNGINPRAISDSISFSTQLLHSVNQNLVPINNKQKEKFEKDYDQEIQQFKYNEIPEEFREQYKDQTNFEGRYGFFFNNKLCYNDCFDFNLKQRIINYIQDNIGTLDIQLNFLEYFGKINIDQRQAILYKVKCLNKHDKQLYDMLLEYSNFLRDHSKYETQDIETQYKNYLVLDKYFSKNRI